MQFNVVVFGGIASLTLLLSIRSHAAPLGSPSHLPVGGKSSFAAKIGKALTPKPAAYHSGKAVSHLKFGAKHTGVGVAALPGHTVVGLAKGTKSAGLALKSPFIDRNGHAGTHLINTALRPAAGIIGGSYLAGKHVAIGAIDLGRSAYHASAYPVAKIHEVVRGKPSAAQQTKYHNKLRTLRGDRDYDFKHQMEEYQGVAHIKLYP